MDSTFSASNRAKKGTGGTPFEQIQSAEEAEQARVKKELDLFDKKQQEAMKLAREKEEKAEQELREEATGELKEFREKEISRLVEDAEAKAKTACKDLESSCSGKEKEVVKTLVDKVTDQNFLTTAA